MKSAFKELHVYVKTNVILDTHTSHTETDLQTYRQMRKHMYLNKQHEKWETDRSVTRRRYQLNHQMGVNFRV